MKLTSPAFSNNQLIPLKYSAFGQNISPPLQITDIPKQAKNLVLIVEDPDASTSKPWQHWLVWNIPPSTSFIAEDSSPPESVQGNNDSGYLGYSGPKPPSGTHRYYFKLFALDYKFELLQRSDRQQLDEMLINHILDQAELLGLYNSPN